MKILVNKKWRDSFLDYHRNPKEYRIKVLGFKNLSKLENVYHTRPKSLKMLLNYLPVMGISGLFYKVWSRIREDYRNEKYISCGFGEILEVADNGKFSIGDIVGFVAPWHPAAAERIALPEILLVKLDKENTPTNSSRSISYIPLGAPTAPSHAWWKDLRAWGVYSGRPLSQELVSRIPEEIKSELKSANWKQAQTLPTDEVSQAVSEIKGKMLPTQKKIGTLFGYGNYAKINIMPYTKKYVDIQTVHEVDPTQIFFEKRKARWDTSPFPRKNEKADVYFIATYNHFHAALAIHALKQGAYALVEKPVVNDYDELKELESALKVAGPKLFIGFQKRYGPFNRWAFKDLGVKQGEPIFYNSIVYELKQPEFFWYTWPVSRSTFYANACHQIDHFLYLNNFSTPTDFGLHVMKDNTIVVWMELQNGATLTSTFSEKGSHRVGPKDIVELKVTGKIARIIDATTYIAEDNYSIIRQRKVHKPTSYREMYQAISKRIGNNEPADSIHSVITSAKIMLDFEELLHSAKGWGDRYVKAKEEFWKYAEKEMRL